MHVMSRALRGIYLHVSCMISHETYDHVRNVRPKTLNAMRRVRLSRQVTPVMQRRPVMSAASGPALTPAVLTGSHGDNMSYNAL